MDKDDGKWTYFIGPAWFALVWWLDDFRGAWLSCVAMLLTILFCLHEVGRKTIAEREKAQEQHQ